MKDNVIEKIDSIIFDLDGTLWDSTATVAKAWQKAIEQVDFVKGTITQADVQAITGMPYKAIFEKLFPYLQQKELNELQTLCSKDELLYMQQYGGNLYNGLEKTLQYLQARYRLFIVSNCQRGYIEAFLEHHNMHQYFDDHECYGSRDLPKAENIKEIIRRNNLQHPVYVGDTGGDYEASQKNNIPFIFASYGFGFVPKPTYSIRQITELETLL
jgi:phosphoglycolate phosphatase